MFSLCNFSKKVKIGILLIYKILNLRVIHVRNLIFDHFVTTILKKNTVNFIPKLKVCFLYPLKLRLSPSRTFLSVDRCQGVGAARRSVATRTRPLDTCRNEIASEEGSGNGFLS